MPFAFRLPPYGGGRGERPIILYVRQDKNTATYSHHYGW